MPDTSGQVATNGDTPYQLTIDEAAVLYARAGHPRTPRSIQRYCASGHLDCVKETTTLGDKYFVNADSVHRHIAQIEELIALDDRATRRDETRPVATPVAQQMSDGHQRHEPLPMSASVATEIASVIDGTGETPRQDATPESTVSRQVATEPEAPSAYVAELKREVDHLKEDKEFLREQVRTKDVQIAALLERDRETNILVGSLQRMLAPLLGGPRHDPRNDDRGSDMDMR